MLNLPKRFILFDLECTSWDGAAARNWSGPGEHREVIQIGATLTDIERFTEQFTVKTLVKPRINPILSEYIKNLTGITQEDINQKGIDFAIFLQTFFDWCCDFEIYCFDSRVDGSRLFDRDVLVENCELCGLEFPFEMDRFHNINEIFARHGYAVKQSGAAPEAFGLKIPARPHDAMNDVNGVLIALKALSERVK
ncbi:MAG: 3'-5' exonuclease [Candidatus Nealsonbacteria bacterium]